MSHGHASTRMSVVAVSIALLYACGSGGNGDNKDGGTDVFVGWTGGAAGVTSGSGGTGGSISTGGTTRTGGTAGAATGGTTPTTDGGAAGTTGTQPIGFICANSTNCSQAQGLTVCCINTCKL